MTLAALALLGFALLVASLSRHVHNLYDEGLIAYGAQRIVDGDVPYRDFWGMYAPGQFYAVAALFKLLGSSLWVMLLWDAALRAAVAAMAYLWARRLGAGAWSLAAWLVTLLLLAGSGFRGFPIFPALLCALVSSDLLLGALRSTRPGWRLVAAGAFVGLATLFRHDMGAYLALAEAAGLAWWVIEAGPGRLPDRLGRLLRLLLPLALGVLLVAGPALALLLMQVPLADIAFNLIVAPATIYPKMRALPFPVLPNPFALINDAMKPADFVESFGIYFPLVVGAGTLGWLALTRPQPDEPPAAPWRIAFALLALITTAFFLKGVVRISALHELQATIPAIVLCFALIARLGARAPHGAIAAALALACAIAWIPGQTALATAAANIGTIRALRNETGLRLGLPRFCAAPAGLERARCLLPRQEDLVMAQGIRSRTSPSEPIYVGTVRHDRIFINNIMLYFLAARPAATKWHELHPGIQTSAAIQAQMIEEFKARDLRVIVLSGEWDAKREPNASAASSGITLLDDYIRASFVEVERSGASSLWVRR